MTTTLRTLGLAALGLALAAPALAQTPDDVEAALARDLVPAQKPFHELGTKKPGKLTVDAWVDNTELTYTIGQQLKIFVRPKQDSYITVLNVGSSGKVAVIFPNYYQREMKVKANATVKIPSDNSGWKINVAGPAGIELIKVIASSQPLKLAELEKIASATAAQPVISLGRSSETVARDLVPQLDTPAQSQAIGVKNILARVVPKADTPALFPFGSQQLSGQFGLVLRPEKPVYKVGENVRVAVVAEKDCRLTLISIGTSGEAIRLFPNPYQTNSLIKAGQVVIVPSPRSPLQFKARGPKGIEGLLATCRDASSTAEAPAVAQGGFANIGDAKSLARDLAAAPDTADQISGSFIVEE